MVPRFERVVLVVLENQPYDAVIGNSSAPEFNRLAGRYGLLTQNYAVTHPSLPNYMALVSGSTQGLGSEDCSCVVNAANLADTVEASGRSWRVYAEGFPSPRFLGSASGRYLKRHNPLLYFNDIVSSRRRLNNFRPLSDFSRDLDRGTLPDFSFVVPDRCHSSRLPYDATTAPRRTMARRPDAGRRRSERIEVGATLWKEGTPPAAFISTAHTETDIDRTIEAADRALTSV